MGTDAHLITVGGPAGALEAAAGELRRLERLWSRFDPTSEISRLGRAAGVPMPVSPETAELVDASVEAWSATDGCFDPTVAAAMVACGYDRSFEAITADSSPAVVASAPGCAGVEVDLASAVVYLPAGVALDVGGIAKGFAADRIATALIESGAVGACVNIGGDTRVIGNDEDGSSWVVAVEHVGLGEVAHLEVFDGGIATTSTKRRQWRRADEDMHHVLDPGTGRPARTGIAGVTVVARAAATAEVWTKAVLVGGLSTEPVAAVGAVVVVTEEGDVVWTQEPAAA